MPILKERGNTKKFNFFFLNPISNQDDKRQPSDNSSKPSSLEGQSNSSSPNSFSPNNNNKNKNVNENVSDRNKTHVQISDSNEAGRALFLNNIQGCKEDVKVLKEKLNKLKYQCEDLVIETKKDFKRVVNKNCKSGTLIVFFFGYGYGEQMYLGLSNTESISFQSFCLEIKKFQENKNDTLILFTNICWKSKFSETKEYRTHEIPEQVLHFCIDIEGECGNGSFMTECILKLKNESGREFKTLARRLSNEINTKIEEEWKGGKYYAYWRSYGVTKNFGFPPLWRVEGE